MQLPSSIDEVITELESILEDCTSNKSRAGYFAALYHKVTCRVKDGILNNEFEDGNRMERLDVLFANRYIAAYRQWKGGGVPSGCWQVAFDATDKRGNLLLQHLLLGINAHINLDLGIATVETLDGKEMSTMLNDFNSINTILASLSYEVMNDITKMSPLLSFLGLHASRGNSILVQFTINNARDGAWMFANELYNKRESDYTDCITKRDKTIAELASGLAKPKGVLKFTTWLIHLFEWKNVVKVIHELRYYRKNYIKINIETKETGDDIVKYMSKYPESTYNIVCYSTLHVFNFDDAVDWACEMLKLGYDTPSLLILAGIIKPTDRWESELYLKQALQELNIPEADTEKAELAYSVYCMLKIARREQVREYLYELHNFGIDNDMLGDAFYMLYYAWSDLDYDNHQWYYWEGADRNNIEDIVVAQAKLWFKEHDDVIKGLL